MSHVVVVDDDPALRSRLRRLLEKEGFETTALGGGGALRELLRTRTADLVVLDLVMPGEDGLSLARFLRERFDHVGILILTGKGDPIDRVVGLEIGADDYLAKPFESRELVARIRSVLRRTAPRPGAAPRAAGRLAFDRWRLDLDRMALTRDDGAAAALTASEFALLARLARSPGRTLSRGQLLEAVAGRSWSPDDRSIDLHVSNLRRKIEQDPRNPRLVKTVRGFGYVFAAPVRAG